MPQVQVPKGDGKRGSRSHWRTVMIACHQIQNACRATGAHATLYCLDYFTIRLFTEMLLFFSFSFVHCLRVLRFGKPILLNEYDDDKTTRVCILCSLLTNLLHELGRRELSNEKFFELYSGALVDQAWAIVHTENEKMSLIPWCTTLAANHCSWTAHAKTHVFCLLTDVSVTSDGVGSPAAGKSLNNYCLLYTSDAADE